MDVVFGDSPTRTVCFFKNKAIGPIIGFATILLEGAGDVDADATLFLLERDGESPSPVVFLADDLDLAVPFGTWRCFVFFGVLVFVVVSPFGIPAALYNRKRKHRGNFDYRASRTLYRRITQNRPQFLSNGGRTTIPRRGISPKIEIFVGVYYVVDLS